MKRKNGRKYYPPLPFVPADVGPDGKVIVPGKDDGGGEGGHAKGNGIVKTESFKETEEERRKREEEEEKEELDRKVRSVRAYLLSCGRVGLASVCFGSFLSPTVDCLVGRASSSSSPCLAKALRLLAFARHSRPSAVPRDTVLPCLIGCLSLTFWIFVFCACDVALHGEFPQGSGGRGCQQGHPSGEEAAGGW